MEIVMTYVAQHRFLPNQMLLQWERPCQKYHLQPISKQKIIHVDASKAYWPLK